MIEVDQSKRATILYKGLSSSYVSRLESLLVQKGYEINDTGHVVPKNRSEDYPKTNTNVYAPVGYLKRCINGDLGYFNIQNIDKEELAPYIAELFNICEEVRKIDED